MNTLKRWATDTALAWCETCLSALGYEGDTDCPCGEFCTSACTSR